MISCEVERGLRGMVADVVGAISMGANLNAMMCL